MSDRQSSSPIIQTAAQRAQEALDELTSRCNSEEIKEELRSRAGYAEAMVKALRRQVDPLLKTLAPDEEIGALLTNFGVSYEVVVTHIGHEDPHLIIIRGYNAQEKEVHLFQHVSQINILFRKIKVGQGKQARRIGFF